MKTTISHAKNLKDDDTLILLVKKGDDLTPYGFSKEELEYIKEELGKKEKKLVTINQYKRWIFVQPLKEKKEFYQ